jgi:hypothetical protein
MIYIKNPMDCKQTGTIYVDQKSELGQMMIQMNKTEEEKLINSCKEKLNSDEITNSQAINGLQNFMKMWDLPNGNSSRQFHYIPNYISELKQNNDNACTIS